MRAFPTAVVPRTRNLGPPRDLRNKG